MYFKTSSADIQTELQAHVADAVDDFMSQGMNKADAQRAAQKKFGNFEQISTGLEAQQSGVALTAPWIAIIAYSLTGVAFVVYRYVVNPALTIAEIQRFAVTELTLTIILLGVFACRWLGEYYGWKNARTLWMPIALILLMGLAITAFLDVDDFEVNVHLLVLTSLVALISALKWSSWSVRTKQCIIYALAIVSLWAAATSRAIFSFIGAPRCLYLTPDPIPYSAANAACHQASWLSPTLLPFYPIIAISLFFLARFIFRYIRNTGTAPIRKIAFAAMFVAIPVFPSAFHDTNNLGSIDVIPWKVEIVRAYQEILGRNPEPKDFTFYAQTRSYLHMDRVRSVLNDSKERRLKINLIYQSVLNRPATNSEIEMWVNQGTAVKEIERSL